MANIHLLVLRFARIVLRESFTSLPTPAAQPVLRAFSLPPQNRRRHHAQAVLRASTPTRELLAAQAAPRVLTRKIWNQLRAFLARLVPLQPSPDLLMPMIVQIAQLASTSLLLDQRVAFHAQQANTGPKRGALPQFNVYHALSVTTRR